MTCDYCGGEHDVYDLCRARGVSRRKFLFLGLGAAAAAVLPAPAGLLRTDVVTPYDFGAPFTLHGIPYHANDAVYRNIWMGFDRALADANLWATLTTPALKPS